MTFLSLSVAQSLLYLSYQRGGLVDVGVLIGFTAISTCFAAIIYIRMGEDWMRDKSRITRRRFLGLLGGAVGAAALGCCGLTVLGMRTPEAELKQLTCGGSSKMSQKILVAYATKAGSTGEVAEAIGKALCAGGAAVEVRPVKEVNDVSGYSGVVVGSAIRIGRWLPEATGFVEANAGTLATMPVAYFQLSGFLQDDTPEKRQEAAAYLASVRALVEPVSEGLFAGKIDYGTLSFFDRTIAKLVGSAEGDWRDWNAIRKWARVVRLFFVV
jgi:menaquinone-dependent protoporphyrinogen oxidase